MRSAPSVFSVAMKSPSFFLNAPANVPRTVCCCQPVAAHICAIVAPEGRFSIAITSACLLFSRVRGFADSMISSIALALGYCDKHLRSIRKQQDARRGSAAARGYDARWRKARTLYLSQHPLCATCQRLGRTVAAQVIDHIVPHRGNRDLFWNERNWQALCKRCHDAKTVREDGGFGNSSDR